MGTVEYAAPWLELLGIEVLILKSKAVTPPIWNNNLQPGRDLHSSPLNAAVLYWFTKLDTKIFF
jgi:hypothetical protein